MANTEITKQIIQRFFVALDFIVENKTIRGIKPFCDEFGIDRRNLYKQKKDLNKGYFQASWIHHLVVNYNISALWLITGYGGMFRTESVK